MAAIIGPLASGQVATHQVFIGDELGRRTHTVPLLDAGLDVELPAGTVASAAVEDFALRQDDRIAQAVGRNGALEFFELLAFELGKQLGEFVRGQLTDGFVLVG